MITHRFFFCHCWMPRALHLWAGYIPYFPCTPSMESKTARKERIRRKKETKKKKRKKKTKVELDRCGQKKLLPLHYLSPPSHFIIPISINPPYILYPCSHYQLPPSNPTPPPPLLPSSPTKMAKLSGLFVCMLIVALDVGAGILGIEAEVAQNKVCSSSPSSSSLDLQKKKEESFWSYECCFFSFWV